jgi:hypothetical protein
MKVASRRRSGCRSRTTSDRAEAAALAGNTDGEDKALAGYAALLDAGVFAWITRDRAEALQALLPAVQAL